MKEQISSGTATWLAAMFYGVAIGFALAATALPFFISPPAVERSVKCG